MDERYLYDQDRPPRTGWRESAAALAILRVELVAAAMIGLGTLARRVAPHLERAAVVLPATAAGLRVDLSPMPAAHNVPGGWDRQASDRNWATEPISC